jgi:hypothetical protein
MFELPTSAKGLITPIFTFVETRDLYNFLAIVEDQNGKQELRTYVHEGQWVNIPLAISKMWYEERLRLVDTADRFDCEAIGASTRLSLEIYHASLGAWDLLTVASKSNSIPLAKKAIIKMADGPSTFSHFEWWTLMSHLRPAWQIELTKLVWEFQSTLVDRRHQERNTRPHDRGETMTREAIMVQTGKTYEEIAAEFDPESEVSIEQEGS